MRLSVELSWLWWLTLGPLTGLHRDCQVLDHAGWSLEDLNLEEAETGNGRLVQ
jgi:hypothetical protein